MNEFLFTETIVVALLLVISVVAIAVRRLRIPYTVALVIVGLAISSQQPVALHLTPALILGLFIPPLVFEAAFHLTAQELQRDIPSILLLAIPGVIVTTLIVGGLIMLGTSVSLPIALIFGALIAATDPVSVVALFRVLRVPKRLAVLVEGESLLNDGTAIVVFNIVLAIALTGHFDLLQGVADFVRVSAGGTIIGLSLGWLTSRVIARIDDYLIETTLTTVLAYGAYLTAEWLGVSGVLAVVAAGLVSGNLGPKGMSPTTRIVLFNFWEYVAFLANSMVFLLIGLQVNIPALVAAWQPIVGAVIAVLIARVVVIYGLGWVNNRFFDESLPMKWQHVLTWGGLRGAISFALVLSLPTELGAQTDLLRLMTFGVVLFTLLIQSTTMARLLQWLRIQTQSQAQDEYEMRHARLVAMQAAADRLQRLHQDGLLSTHALEILKPETEQQILALSNQMREMLLAAPDLEAEELDTAKRELLRAQRGALLGLRRDGVISEEIYEQLAAQVDTELISSESLASDRRSTTGE